MSGHWRRGFQTAIQRRRILRQHFDVHSLFEQLEESCIPSYCHGNVAAATVAWQRLIVAASLHAKYAQPGPILDFGASTGELFHFLTWRTDYHFVEEIDLLAEAADEFVPGARRHTLEDLPKDWFAALFALDSLEHNDDLASVLERLLPSLRDDGVLIVSGPTENLLYRLGRSAVRFSGHYHKVTVFEIEDRLRSVPLRCLERRIVPFRIPLFNLSAWKDQ